MKEELLKVLDNIRACAYARVSTKHQSDLSLDAQFTEIEREANRYGMKIIQKYSDKESGKNTGRKNFLKMLEDCREGLYNVIFVHDFQRFGRGGASDEVLIEELQKEGIFTISVNGGVNPMDDIAEVLRGMNLILGGWERKKIASRTAHRMRSYAENGFFMGGLPPYGYKVIEVKDPYGKKRKKLEIDEEKAPVVKEIFERFSKGDSYNIIIESLNKRGIKSQRDKKFSKTSIFDILHNKKYCGIQIYAKGSKHQHHINRKDAIEVKGVLPAIISEELYFKCSERFRTIPPRKNEYLLSGFIFCGICGHKMSGSGGNRMVTYRCLRHKPSRQISRRKVENHVIEYLKHEIINKFERQGIEEAVNVMNKFARKLDKNKEIRKTKLVKKLDSVIEEENNIIAAIKKGIPLDSLLEESAKIREERKDIEEKIKKIDEDKQKYITVDSLQIKMTELKNAIESQEFEALRAAIRYYIKKVVISDNGYIQIIPTSDN